MYADATGNGLTSIMVDAHMDEATYRGGIVRFSTVGLIDETILPAQPVVLLTEDGDVNGLGQGQQRTPDQG